MNELPEKARQFAMLSVQSIRLRNFFQKLLAIAQNSSVAAFFFFPLIQFVDSEKKSTYAFVALIKKIATCIDLRFWSGLLRAAFEPAEGVADKTIKRSDLFWKTGGDLPLKGIKILHTILNKFS